MTLDEGYHTPLEEYLETILSLGDEGTDVIGARIAERLGRSAPSVKEMVDRLEEDGYVTRQGRSIELTQRGREVAVTVTRRHRLAERLLVDVIGLEWYKVHDEAGKWEHVISPDVEAKLIELLGDPATCPHGNPIPGSAKAQGVAVVSLSSGTPGDAVTLVRIAESVEHDERVLRAMDEVDFIPGKSGTITEYLDDGSVVVATAKGALTLAPGIADALFVAA
jgi:DtxR family transcriptional regulator, Mn-dependent transcriptional regulator